MRSGGLDYAAAAEDNPLSRTRTQCGGKARMASHKDDDHGKSHDHQHGSELSEMQVRVRALLTEFGIDS